MNAYEEIKSAFEEYRRAVESYKAENDARLEAMAKGQAVDGLSRDKIARMEEDIARLETVISRPALGGGDGGVNDNDARHAKAFEDYARKGDERGLLGLEGKALSVGSPADGGYALPLAIDGQIERLLNEATDLRPLATVRQISGGEFRRLAAIGGGASGWVGETDARPETASPQFAEIVPAMGEIYANPRATQQSLDDLSFDVTAFLAEEIAAEFALRESEAFIAGDGNNKPKGLIAYPVSAGDDDARPFGTLQYLATGTDGNFDVADPADVLIDLVYALKPAYRRNAHWLMNANLTATLRRMKDGQGRYLWEPSLAPGTPATLLGYPLGEAAAMPDIASDSLSIAFGDFRRAYLIVDRTGIRTLRDPYSAKPYVHFYATKRVGGAVQNSDAVKLVKFGLS